MGKSTISMAIFNTYVRLPQGNHLQHQLDIPRTLSMRSKLLFHQRVRQGGPYENDGNEPWGVGSPKSRVICQ